MQYFVFNKAADYRRGWQDNVACTGSHIQVADTSRPGVFWSRLLDSREKETIWHRLTLDSHSLGDASIRMSFYCADSPDVFWQGQSQPLARLLSDPTLTDDDRRTLSAPFLVNTELSPQDILLHHISGRYVWFRLYLVPLGDESPRVGNLRLRLPKQSWLDYLPEVYREDAPSASFTERYLAIFQSLYSDLDEEIRSIARHFDPDIVGGDYLDWLASWLNIEDTYLWPEEKLRQLVREGVALYRMRGTRQYMVEMIRLYTGHTPYLVEHSQVEPFLGDVARTQLLQELYGDTPYMVTIVLDGSALKSNEEHKALLRIVENSKPAWIEANLVILKPYIFLDKYTYLGMNSTLDRYRPLNLDGYSALPFTSLGGYEIQL